MDRVDSDRHAMTDGMKQQVWDSLRGVDRTKMDFLLDFGSREYAQQVSSRQSIRSRIQTLMVLLVSGVSAFLVAVMSGAGGVGRLVAMGVPSAVWSCCFFYLLFFVRVRVFWDAWGSPVDNLGPVLLDEMKRRKLYELELSIHETASGNREMRMAFNACLMLSSFSLFAGAGAGLFCHFCLGL